jgi:hypothetical protein
MPPYTMTMFSNEKHPPALPCASPLSVPYPHPPVSPRPRVTTGYTNRSGKVSASRSSKKATRSGFLAQRHRVQHAPSQRCATPSPICQPTARSLMTDFAYLHPRALHTSGRLMVEMRTRWPDESVLMFFAFDILHQDGVDLRSALAHRTETRF